MKNEAKLLLYYKSGDEVVMNKLKLISSNLTGLTAL